MRTRPILPFSDAAIRGHVFCTFLALSCKNTSTIWLQRRKTSPEWRLLLRDLDRLQRARIQLRGKDWLVRTDAPASVAALFLQARIALPPARLPGVATADRTGQLQKDAAVQSVVPRRHEFRQFFFWINEFAKRCLIVESFPPLLISIKGGLISVIHEKL